jgi:CHAT domain-containing protein
MNANLVVLSACNTAGEKENTRHGEGFAGLTRAFMYAGAKGLLVSHWSVDSQTTRDLMIEVFKRLKSGLPPDQAVAQAQAAIRAGDSRMAPRAHPFFWAPFVYVGD